MTLNVTPGSTFGRKVLDQVGESIRVSVDGHPLWKVGGVTVDWTTVAVASADFYDQDGFFCPAGEAYLRYGQVLTRITAAAQVQTITVTGTPTSGNFTVYGVNPFTGAGASVVIDWNSTASAAQTRFDAAWGAGNTTIGGGALPGTALTVTFNGEWGNTVAALIVTSNGLQGGTTPAASVAITTPGNTTGGFWGPFDPSASDGRQTLTNGQTFILDSSVRVTGNPHSAHPPVIQGGRVWQPRIIATSGTHSLAAGPTWTELAAAMPLLAYVTF